MSEARARLFCNLLVKVVGWNASKGYSQGKFLNVKLKTSTHER